MEEERERLWREVFFNCRSLRWTRGIQRMRFAYFFSSKTTCLAQKRFLGWEGKLCNYCWRIFFVVRMLCAFVCNYVHYYLRRKLWLSLSLLSIFSYLGGREKKNTHINFPGKIGREKGMHATDWRGGEKRNALLLFANMFFAGKSVFPAKKIIGVHAPHEKVKGQ